MLGFALRAGILLLACLSLLAQDVASSPKDLPTLSESVTYVQVPVTVKDHAGRRVEGLSPQDFALYEDRVLQNLSFFSSDPFPLAAAVVVDTNLPADAVKAVHRSLPALFAGFSAFDEIAFFTYGSRVEQVFGFTSAADASLVPLKRIDDASLQEPHVLHVLSDALLLAAQGLGGRDSATRRRIILVISNGQEHGSSARYDEVRKELLSNDVAVYALALGGLEPVYDKEGSLTGVKGGLGRALSRLVSDTGGDDFFMESESEPIAGAYAKIIETARNRYTLGYNSQGSASTFRTLEVRVHRPGLVVIAKAGYYPAQRK